MTRVVVVDCYDSFVYNLVHYLAELGADVLVRRQDEVGVADLRSLRPDAVLLSPGPGTPERAGVSVDAVKACEDDDVPLLGVCLGHQAIAVAHGAVVDRAPEVLHGRTSEVVHDGAGVLAGLPSPFVATRYHSLAVVPETVTDDLEVTARSPSGVVMGLRVRGARVDGVQFHPESVMTDLGHRMLATWLRGAGHVVDDAVLDEASRRAGRRRGQASATAGPAPVVPGASGEAEPVGVG